MARCARGCCESQAAHYRSLSVAPRMLEVGRPHQRDAALEYDRVAYKALRRQGYQPPKIDGSYDLCRRATSEAEIRLGQVIDEKDARRKRKGTRLMENMLEISDHAMTGKIPEKGGKKKLRMRP
jgi:hypothetical protein